MKGSTTLSKGGHPDVFRHTQKGILKVKVRNQFCKFSFYSVFLVIHAAQMKMLQFICFYIPG